jgi:hypothetical protein
MRYLAMSHERRTCTWESRIHIVEPISRLAYSHGLEKSIAVLQKIQLRICLPLEPLFVMVRICKCGAIQDEAVNDRWTSCGISPTQYGIHSDFDFVLHRHNWQIHRR